MIHTQTQPSFIRLSLLFTGASSGEFTLLEWSDSIKMSLIWRSAFLAYFVGTFIYNYVIIAMGCNCTFPLAYFTRWGELANLIYAIVSFATVMVAIKKNRSPSEPNTTLETFSGFLMELSSTASIAVMILYYSTASLPSDTLEENVAWTFGSLNVHMFMVVLHLIDSFSIRVRRRIGHFWLSSTFMLCYVIVNFAIFVITLVRFNKALDWMMRPELAAGIGIGAAVLGMPILHAVWCLLTLFRVKVSDKVKMVGVGDDSLRFKKKENCDAYVSTHT